MTANLNLSHSRPIVKKHWDENSKLYSLFFLVVLLVSVFTFWSPQGEGYYTNKQLEATESAAGLTRSESDNEAQYRTIVTNGDAIRSVFQ